MPHDPMLVDNKYINDFTHCKKIKSWRRRVYCGMVTCVDEGIGNITSYLKNNNLLQDTLIIFSSDNGGFANVGGFNYPSRGMKISPYEGGVKTVSFIFGPNIFIYTSGMIFDGNIHLVDWGPTILSIVDSTMNKQNSFHDIMGNDIDGWDYSDTLKNFHDKTFETLSRNEFIVEARWWNNMTVYRYNEFKLFLGTIIFDQLFIEPDDIYAINSYDRNKYENYDWIVTDYINYFIFNVLGTDWFWFEWNVALIGRMLWLGYNTDGECPSVQLPTLDKRPANKQTFHWPHIDSWDEKCQRIRLYNLNDDPTESNNLAYKSEYKEIVIDILNKLRNKLENERKLNQIEYDRSSDGLMDFVHETQIKLRRIAIIILLIVIGSLCICCCGLYRCCKRVTQSKSKKD
eukprot:18348_1